MKKDNKTMARRLTESAIMIALATILSLVKLVDLPYGGSITLASMLPIMIIAYRYGTAWGLMTGLVHGTLQLILGASTLSYATSAAAAAAIIMLDYLIAFAVIGFAGIFRKMKSESAALVCGALLCCFLRYVCHVISGATVWAGLSIPTAGALMYSLVYNATYMIPEMLVLAVVSFYVSVLIDFSAPRVSGAKTVKADFASIIAVGGAACAALVFDTASVFGKLQSGDSGEFDITGIANVNWTAVIVVTVCCIAAAALFCAVRYAIIKKGQKG